jgi:hypothetical protein
MDYTPSHLYGHTVVKVLSFLLILPNALYERRFRANGSHDCQLPNSPRTDSFDKLRTGSGVRFSRTGLFRNTRFRNPA